MTEFDPLVERTRAVLTDPDYLAPIVGFIGLIGITANLFITNPFAVVFPSSLIAAAVIYYVLRDQERGEALSFSLDIRAAYSVYFASLSVLLLSYQVVGYERTFQIHLLTLVLYAVTIIVMYTQQAKYSLPTIFLTGIVHRATMVYNSPIILGNDSLFHNRMASQIAEQGTRAPLAAANSKYFDVPMYHIETALSSLLFDLPMRDTAFLVITVSYVVIPGSVVYLFGKRFGSKQTGLLASLLFISADFSLGWSVQPQATSMGLILFSVVLLLTVIYIRTPQKTNFIALAIVFITLSLTHHISVFVSTTAIAFLISGYQVVRTERSLMKIPVFMFTTLAGTWAFDRHFGPGSNSTDFLTLTGSSIVARLSTIGLFSRESTTQTIGVAATPSGAASLDVLNIAGSGLLVLFGVGGFLLLIRNKRSQFRPEIFGIGTAIGLLFATAFAGPIVGFRFFQPMRWFQFIYILLVPLAGIVIMRISRSIQNDRLSFASTGMILLLFISLMGGTFIGGLDDPIFDDANGAQRYELENQEYKLLEYTATTNSDETIITGDFLSNVILDRYYTTTSTMLKIHQGKDRINIRSNTLVIERPYLQTNHVSFTYVMPDKSIRLVGSLPENAINCKKSNRVYHSGSEGDTNYALNYIQSRCVGET